MRNYTKIYTPTQQLKNETLKLHLGYQNTSREIILYKDKETYFHVPPFAKPLLLVNSELVENGATGGPFPAASDRIFKNKKNYGNVTNQGTGSDIQDGTWFCSWLYKNSNGDLQWMDRFYNPGQFIFADIEEQLLFPLEYRNNQKIFRDVPSKMIFEPGVLYRYYHVGETTIKNLTSSFNGLTGERLLLHLKEWDSDTIDVSKNNIPVTINTSVSPGNLFQTTTNFLNQTETKVINFNQPTNVEVIIEWADEYTENCKKENTLMGWTYSENWQSNQTTQLFGNFSSKGGYGLYIDSLNTYPFFVIPETKEGHIIFVNPEGLPILDKVTTVGQVSISPKCIAINSDDHLIVCNNDSTGTVYKLDSAGNVLASSKSALAPMSFFKSDERPVHVLCGQNDSVVVVTTKAEYYLDSNLNLLNTVVINTDENAAAAFMYDIVADEATLIVNNDYVDLKFSDYNQWSILAEDRLLYKDEELVSEDLINCKKIQIDPFDRVWVFHNNNEISVIDSNSLTNEVVFKTTVGIDAARDIQDIQFSFLNVYDHATKTTDWQAVVYFSNESLIYFLNMKGKLIQTLNINSFYNLYALSRLDQSVEEFEYLGKGDFTGYEYKRVFKKLSPYNNQQQLVLKTSLQNRSTNASDFSVFKHYIPINDWESKSWQHLVVILQNKKFSVYVNAEHKGTLYFPAKFELSYEQQPTFFIGSSTGSKNGFNKENNSISQIFNGLIGEIKILNYAIEDSKLLLFLQEHFVADDIFWPLPTPSVQYIETIERFFQNKIPGHKSNFFEIILMGTHIKDVQTRSIIEEYLKTHISKVAPLYTSLIKFVWR